ncbi:hypothetical protein RJ640_011474 [Escallonia rubra]|uniref:P-type ATPase A domain-containing protein n=1 Tax=Escallonia rubra TaxID=112253 RepID=A0AA88RKB9_9ASTE|nr:hypothetical protein RJ640_011474 [Escallonia rubra]
MYGDNQPAAKTFHHFVLEALMDPMIVILLVSTVLFIGFGIRKLGLEVGWYEGVPKLAAISGAILASAGSNFWPERQCQKLSVDSSKIQQVDVVRNGHWQRVDTPDIVVGDVVYLTPGDQVPADGLYLDNESSIQVDMLKTDGQSVHITVDGQENPFFSSGTNVVLGYARMVVTVVGKNRESQTIKFDGKLVEQLENLTSVMEVNDGVCPTADAITVSALPVLGTDVLDIFNRKWNDKKMPMSD